MKRTVKKNKSKIGIWTKIKNIYNNSPWNAAFIYPILYIFVISILGGLIAAGGSSGDEIGLLAYIGISLMISIYLTPIWVFVGLFVSKKKLPYILSLCIGLGLLGILIYISLKMMPGM
tara:strand:- start:3 stop:356 length:354 start_codon:yes stop_codon:yes gene_type:complete